MRGLLDSSFICLLWFLMRQINKPAHNSGNCTHHDGKFVTVTTEPDLNTGLTAKGKEKLKDGEVEYDFFKPNAFMPPRQSNQENWSSFFWDSLSGASVSLVPSKPHHMQHYIFQSILF